LHIENIAVIKNIDIELGKGFTVLTGETGAGKSIIIDSINLLLGGRISKDIIRTGEENAMVSALFTDISESNIAILSEIGVDASTEMMLQRNITADGRSTTRLNGRVISAALQKDIGKLLINIHGQHDNQSLLQPTRHIFFLDSYAENIFEILKTYETHYDLMMDTKKKISELSRNEQEKARMIELLKYQITDIDSAKLKENEEDVLVNNRNKIQNYEKIAREVKLVYRALYKNEKGGSAFDFISRAVDALEQINSVLPEADGYIEKLNNFKYEIEDIAESVKDILSEDYDNPTVELNKIESRLETIYKLKRKYGSTITEILEFRKKSAAQLEDIELSDVKITELNKDLKIHTEDARNYASQLTALRIATAKILEEKIMSELAYLDMEKVKFEVDIKPEENHFTRQGVDNVEFVIATNPGEPLKPLSRIASGGELSRIMLALKSVFAKRENVETLIFDEIDTGISGKTSEKIGIKLKQTAKDCQIICVTHSAQIAATADCHLYISKSEIGGRVETAVTVLEYDSRVNEIARIMGGIQITETLLETVKEMLDKNKGE
ncbi:MAG: DNA repair protein RecN, partial [Oscillospiraceae bacterium]|nr:DNA repair protein RecN [Oscillospiraceae bacterium]